ncbi:MAG: hypothetical protein ACPGSD_01140 [Flavobacteriales bacterium]
MKAETKELLDEMLTLSKKKLPPRFYMKHLLDALENCTDINLPLTTTWLLNWLKGGNKDFSVRESYEFDHENDKARFQEFFSYCTTLNDIFVLHVNAITWQDSVSEEEKMEILDYVDKNYDWKMRYRTWR